MTKLLIHKLRFSNIYALNSAVEQLCYSLMNISQFFGKAVSWRSCSGAYNTSNRFFLLSILRNSFKSQENQNKEKITPPRESPIGTEILPRCSFLDNIEQVFPSYWSFPASFVDHQESPYRWVVLILTFLPFFCFSLPDLLFAAWYNKRHDCSKNGRLLIGGKIRKELPGK